MTLSHTAMSQKDNKHLQRAIDLAAHHSRDGRHGPFGAVIVKEDEVVAEGWNGVVDDIDPTAHAEVQAIRAAAKKLNSHDLSGCTIYASCEPCPMCLAAIYWARIDRVVYAATKDDAASVGFDDSLLYEEIAKPWPARKMNWDQALREKAAAMMQSWAENPDSVEY